MEKMNDEELNIVNGGTGSGVGYYLTVGNCNGHYLALRPQPVWDQYNELARMYPGYRVFTYGATTNGIGLNGVHCVYTYVQFNGIWGWADTCFLRS